MRGRIVILIIILLVVVAAVVGALVLLGGNGDDTADQADTTEGTTDGEVTDEGSTEGDDDSLESPPDEDEDEDEPIPPPIEIQTAPVVVAVQDLPRGFRLEEQFLSGGSPAVGVVFWPIDSIPADGYQDPALLTNLIVRADIPRGTPILSTQLVADGTALGAVGSDAAILLDPGQVAVSVPLDPAGINFAARSPQPGDQVDVILSFLFIEVDETFQSRQPNLISVITRNEEGDLTFGDAIEGRAEPSPLSALGVVVGPSEQQRPRLVTQRTVTGADVIHIGFFPPNGRILGGRTATPTPFDTPTPDPDTEQAAPTATPLPTSTPYQPVIVTLGVDPQDALVLVWALDAQIPTTLVLRSANDQGEPAATTSVTLQYLIENFDIPEPPILPFALEPSIQSLRNVGLDIFSNIGFEETGEEE